MATSGTPPSRPPERPVQRRTVPPAVRDPGLDMAVLARHLRPRHDTTALIDRVAAHLDRWDGYLAFSGGKDSTTVLHLARQADPDVPVCFFDSGLEFPETHRYIADLADRWSLNLHVIPAAPSALELLRAGGGWDHDARTRPEFLRGSTLHDALITVPAGIAHAHHGAGELWGIRAEESRGRRVMLLRALRAEIDAACSSCCSDPPAGQAHTRLQRTRHGGLVRRQDATAAYSPIWEFTNQEVHQHLHRHHVPVNPVYDRLITLGAPAHLQRVGLTVDATSAGLGRFAWLRRGWPEMFDCIADVLPRMRDYV